MNKDINVKLIADVTLLYNGKVLLVKYKDSNKYDHQKGWFLPDDLIKENEKAEDSAFRILKEQLVIKEIIPLFLNHTESFRGNDNTRHEVSHFLSNLNVMPEINSTNDISEVKWFGINELPDKKEIAHHGWAKFTVDKVISNLNKK